MKIVNHMRTPSPDKRDVVLIFCSALGATTLSCQNDSSDLSLIVSLIF